MDALPANKQEPTAAPKNIPVRVMVAQVLSPHQIVLNKGSSDGLKYGQRFLVYAIGNDVTDPETGKSLGKLEIVRGTGRVVHLQETMCTVQSDMKTDPLRTIRKTSPSAGWVTVLGGLSGQVIEEELPPEALPFEKAERGDFAKPV